MMLKVGPCLLEWVGGWCVFQIFEFGGQMGRNKRY